MFLDDGGSLWVSKSFTHIQQMKIQSGIHRGECRDEPAVDKYQARCCIRTNLDAQLLRNRCERMIDRGLECSPADWSHIRVLPILKLRCWKAERKEAVYSFSPQPLEPGQIATRQPLADRRKLSGVDVLFCQYGAHETFLDGCALSGLHSLR